MSTTFTPARSIILKKQHQMSTLFASLVPSILDIFMQTDLLPSHKSGVGGGICVHVHVYTSSTLTSHLVLSPMALENGHEDLFKKTVIAMRMFLSNVLETAAPSVPLET